MPHHQEGQVSLYHKHTWPTTQTDSSKQLSFWEEAATLRSFDLADSLMKCSPTEKVNISPLTKCIKCQSALHNVLSCVLFHVCPAPLRHVQRPPRLRLVCTLLATFYLSRHSTTRHTANDQQNEAKAEVEIRAQGIFSKGSATLAVS